MFWIVCNRGQESRLFCHLNLDHAKSFWKLEHVLHFTQADFCPCWSIQNHLSCVTCEQKTPIMKPVGCLSCPLASPITVVQRVKFGEVFFFFGRPPQLHLSLGASTLPPVWRPRELMPKCFLLYYFLSLGVESSPFFMLSSVSIRSLTHMAVRVLTLHAVFVPPSWGGWNILAGTTLQSLSVAGTVL